MYTPLIDLTPSDASTMMTAMVEAERLTNMTGQTNTIFTADQKLYKVFTGCIGSLMSNSGLEEVLKKTFGGVEKMLLRNKVASFSQHSELEMFLESNNCSFVFSLPGLREKGNGCYTLLQ